MICFLAVRCNGIHLIVTCGHPSVTLRDLAGASRCGSLDDDVDALARVQRRVRCSLCTSGSIEQSASRSRGSGCTLSASILGTRINAFTTHLNPSTSPIQLPRQSCPNLPRTPPPPRRLPRTRVSLRATRTMEKRRRPERNPNMRLALGVESPSPLKAISPSLLKRSRQFRL